jgi:hypothetical protein
LSSSSAMACKRRMAVTWSKISMFYEPSVLSCMEA